MADGNRDQKRTGTAFDSCLRPSAHDLFQGENLDRRVMIKLEPDLIPFL